MNFIDWTHTSNNFTESNIKTINSELMGTKLHHDPKNIIYNFSSYDLKEISMLLKSLNVFLTLQKLKIENDLCTFKLLYRYVINDEKKDGDALTQLRIKIKDIGLS